MSERFISQEDIQALLDSKMCMKYKICLIIGSCDGLRIGEILKLQLEDLEFDRNLYRLKRQKNGLLMKTRYMSDYVKGILKAYIMKYKDNIKARHNYIIYSNGKYGYITPVTVGRQLQLWEEKLNIRKVYKISKSGHRLALNSFHATRVKSVNDLIKRMIDRYGVIDPIQVMAHGGWTNLQSIQPYLRVNEEVIRAMGRRREEMTARLFLVCSLCSSVLFNWL